MKIVSSGDNSLHGAHPQLIQETEEFYPDMPHIRRLDAYPDGPWLFAGFFRGGIGISEATRLLVEDMWEKGQDVRVVDISHVAALDALSSPFPLCALEDAPEHGPLVLCCNPFEMPPALEYLGPRLTSERKIIALWHWELDIVPPSWLWACKYLDEVWVPSTFLARILKGAPVPVRTVPYHIKEMPDGGHSLADLGLPGGLEQKRIFLCMADCRSDLRRKNIYGAVKAFVETLGDSGENVLVIKLQGMEAGGGELERIRELCRCYNNVWMLEKLLTVEERNSLMHRMDVLISLHRAEGFGLTMLEAQTLGKYVVATRYSGPEDFLGGDRTYAIPYTKTLVITDHNVYRSWSGKASWAEPDLEAAKEALRDIAGKNISAPEHRASRDTDVTFPRLDLSFSDSIQLKVYRGIVKVLRPFVPYLARWPLALRVRSWFLRSELAAVEYTPYADGGTSYTDWVALHTSPSALARLVVRGRGENLSVLLDTRRATAREAIRSLHLLQARNGMPKALRIITDTPSRLPPAVRKFCVGTRRLAAGLPETSHVLYIEAAASFHPALVTCCAALLRDAPHADLLYFDEWRTDEHRVVENVFCKPAWDPVLFENSAYTGPVFAVSAALLHTVLNKQGSQMAHGAELFAACAHHTHGLVAHAPLPLFGVQGSDPAPPPAGGTANAGNRGKVLSQKVSVIIPFRDRYDLLKPCIESLVTTAGHPDWECILVDNGSQEQDVLRFIQGLDPERFTILRLDIPFNYAALINRAVEKTKGDVLVLLNNDTEALVPSWMRMMAEQALSPDTGCVGAKLLYPDGTIQHGGVAAGTPSAEGYLIHGHRHWRGDTDGYFGFMRYPRTNFAVTGAVLAIRRDAFLTLGGLDENLGSDYNDVDLCCKAMSRGLRNILLPDVVFTHRECASRGFADNPGEKARRQREFEYFRAKWPDTVTDDPWYNPNLMVSDNANNFTLTPSPRDRHVRIMTATGIRTDIPVLR